MTKFTKYLCFLLLLLAVKCQDKVSQFNIDISVNDLRKIDYTKLIKVENSPVGKVCLDHLQDGVNECARSIRQKLLATDLHYQIEQAREYEDNKTLLKLMIKAQCCAIWDVMDCGIDVIKQCNSTEQNNMGDFFLDTRIRVHKFWCKSNKYHSKGCEVKENYAVLFMVVVCFILFNIFAISIIYLTNK